MKARTKLEGGLTVSGKQKIERMKEGKRETNTTMMMSEEIIFQDRGRRSILFVGIRIGEKTFTPHRSQCWDRMGPDP